MDFGCCAWMRVFLGVESPAEPAEGAAGKEEIEADGAGGGEVVEVEARRAPLADEGCTGGAAVN